MNLDQQPMISIIMPAFNSEKTIMQSIQSVVQQTYSNWELIIIEDGTTDSTEASVLALKDTRICFYRNPINLGVSKTRNRGLDLAKGEWIAFLDSDDLWDKDKLQKQFDCALVNRAAFVYCAAKYINEHGKSYKGISIVNEKVSFDQLLNYNMIACSSVLVKKSLIGELRFVSDNLSEDYAMWLSLLKKVPLAYGINEPLLTYRISTTSRSGNKIRSLLRGYRVYRHLGISSLKSMFHIFNHLYHSYKKYRKIFSGKVRNKMKQ